MGFNPSGGGGISGASDVALNSTQDNQSLTYDSASDKWVNETVAGGATNLTTTQSATTVTVVSNTGTDAVLPAATITDAGVLTGADKTKLNGITTAATANATDAQLRDRSTHTGSQNLATISDFAAEIRKTDAVQRAVSGTYALRSTVTSDAARRVRWVGPSAPTIGSGYAIDGLDVWEQTA